MAVETALGLSLIHISRDVPGGEVDVVVCDGFTGNVILKLTEGVAKMLLGMLKQMFLANLGGKLAYLLLKGSVAAVSYTHLQCPPLRSGRIR